MKKHVLLITLLLCAAQAFGADSPMQAVTSVEIPMQAETSMNITNTINQMNKSLKTVQKTLAQTPLNQLPEDFRTQTSRQLTDIAQRAVYNLEHSQGFQPVDVEDLEDIILTANMLQLRLLPEGQNGPQGRAFRRLTFQ